MPRVANKFIDPKGVRATYSWPLNHDEEEQFGKRRNIEHSAPTAPNVTPPTGQANIGLVRQQGDDSPLVLQLRGKILTEAMMVEMLAWYKLSRTQTVYFEDWTGDKFEVIISAFEPRRVRVSENLNDFVNWPHHYVQYQVEMEVVNVLAGLWVGVPI